MTEEHRKPKRKFRPYRAFVKLFGVRYPEEKSHWILLTKRFRRIVLGVILLVLVAVVSFLFYFSARPEFCNSCHIMEKYVESWRVSSHNEVSCLDCHFAPGWGNFLRSKLAATSDVITVLTGKARGKPYSEIEDASCLRDGCHETRLLEGKVVFKGKYNFDHTPHLAELRRGKKLRCTSCHSQIVQGAHIAVTETVCFACHFKGLVHDRTLDPIGGCTSCHDAPTETIKTARGITFDHGPFLDRDVACWKCHFDSVRGTGDVPRQVCLTCHSEREKLEQYTDAQFMHDWHVTKRKVECYRCHDEIVHGLHPEPIAQKSGCTMCHFGGHGTHTDMFAGRGGRGVEPNPSEHSLANVDCVACHEMPSLTRDKVIVDTGTHKAKEHACLACHGSRMAGTLEEWKSTLNETLLEVKEEITAAEAAFANQPDTDPRKGEVKVLLETARYNYEFIKKASGVHNLPYAMDLLDIALESATEAKEITEASTTTSKIAQQEQ